MAMAMAGAGKHIMTWEIITGAGFKLRGTLVIGENWGAKLKLGGYEEHWQAQAMAMSVDIIGIEAGARLKLLICEIELLICEIKTSHCLVAYNGSFVFRFIVCVILVEINTVDTVFLVSLFVVFGFVFGFVTGFVAGFTSIFILVFTSIFILVFVGIRVFVFVFVRRVRVGI